MYREWRLNPPPNWPVPADAVVGLDWRPDPAWGPPPVGWPLWQRRRVVNTRRGAVPGAGALGLALGVVALVAALTGEPAGPPAVTTPYVSRTALIGPAIFPAGLTTGWATSSFSSSGTDGP